MNKRIGLRIDPAFKKDNLAPWAVSGEIVTGSVGKIDAHRAASLGRAASFLQAPPHPIAETSAERRNSSRNRVVSGQAFANSRRGVGLARAEKGVSTMPVRWQIDRGFSIVAGQTQWWHWQFFTDHAPGTGPNQGPILFAALPKGPSQGGNNTAKNKLVIFDFAKSRGGPGDDHAPEVFYEFKIRNESTVDVKFMLEFVLFSDLPIHFG